MDDMTDDTPALTSHDLETIKAALWPVWFELQSRGEQPAADWIGARIKPCAGETVGLPESGGRASVRGGCHERG